MVFVFAGTFIGFFVYIPSLALSIKESLWIVALADTAIYTWLIILFLFPSLPYTVRASSLSLVSYILGMILMLIIGPFGGGPVWLFAFPVIVAMLLGLRYSVLALGINTITLVVMGVLLHFGFFNWNQATINPLEKWIVVSLNFLFLSSIVTISIALIFKGLQQAIERQKTLYDSLVGSEEKFRALFETAPDAYYLYDQNGALIDGNPAAEKLIGYSKDSFLGLDIMKSQFIEPKQTDKIKQIIAKNRAGLSSGPDIFTLVKSDGSHIFIELLTVPIHIKGKSLFLGIARDITERKRLEKSLYKAQKMEAIGKLAGGVAHDFNNLLQIMGGYTDLLLLDKDEHHPDSEKLWTVYNAVGRASELVKQLLLFSRKAHVKTNVIDLNQIIEQTVIILKRTIPKMISVVFQGGGHLWTIQADAIQMEQMLLNLGSNAVDAMPDGGQLMLTTENCYLEESFARTHPGSQCGNHVLLKVSDSGFGMNNEMLSHIFEPFFTSKDAGKGTGLGLASVYGIVKAHGGYISCHSVPGEGTVFSVYLPANPGARADIAPSIEAAPPRGQNETIIIAEDEDEIRAFMVHTLEQSGYRVISCSTGEELLSVFAENRKEADLIILDLNMPGMGGMKCLSELHRIDENIKVLIASGYAENWQQPGKPDAKVRGFIQKPFNSGQLLKKIGEILA